MLSYLHRAMMVACSFCVAIAAQVVSAAAVPEVPKDMVLFLLVGQSNMAGRGRMADADKIPIPGAWMLDKDNKWVPAHDPVHQDRAYAGVGPGSEFARRYLAAHPGAHVGLVPCAVGGSAIGSWQPANQRHGEAMNYSNAVVRAKLAIANGKFAAILWHQGESDSFNKKKGVFFNEGKYAKMLAATLAGFRQELGTDVPVIVGELGPFYGGAAAFNPAINKIAAATPHCACVSSKGLVDGGDQTHFDTASARALGARYFEAFVNLTAASAVSEAK